jgi:hypothetical protein
VTPQEEKELLLRVVLRIAQTQLEKGGFIPFGATLGPGREAQLLMPTSAKREITIDKVVAYWKVQMSKAIETSKITTLCTVTDVRISDNDGKLIPGVFIHVEHWAGDAEDILFPYTKDENAKVTLQEPAKEATNLQFFVTSDDSSRH